MAARAEDLKFLTYTSKVSYTHFDDGTGTWVQLYFMDGKKQVVISDYTMKLFYPKAINQEEAWVKMDNVTPTMFGKLILPDTKDRQFIYLVYNSIGTMIRSGNIIIRGKK